jgi:glycyl-tRNA synthetase beta subunit
VTYGHRFLATSGRAGRAIKVRSFDEYRKKLTENFVHALADRAARSHLRDLEAQARRKVGGRAMIQQHRAGRGAARRSAGSGRVSRPSSRAPSAPSSSRLPDEVLTTTLIHHQHFFPVVSASGGCCRRSSR